PARESATSGRRYSTARGGERRKPTAPASYSAWPRRFSRLALPPRQALVTAGWLRSSRNGSAALSRRRRLGKPGRARAGEERVALLYDELCRTWDPGGFVPPLYNLGVALTDGQVRQGRGDKPALLWENAAGRTRSLTYRQLDAVTNRLASSLRNLGVHHGD